MTDGDETIGAVLRTRDRVKPLFVSPGHLCDLEGAIAAVLASTRGYRLPVTTRLAHDYVNEMRRRAGLEALETQELHRVFRILEGHRGSRAS